MKQLPVIACSLTDEQLTVRLEEFRSLVSQATSVIRIDGGARIMLPPQHGAAARDLFDREQQCCPFWDFTISEREGALVVEARAPAEAGPLVERLFLSD